MIKVHHGVSSPPFDGGEDQGEGAVAFARSLRKQPTWAERTLWKLLRSRQLSGFKFRRQHPVGPYVLDFFCVTAKVAVELDGDVHGEPGQRAHDKAKDRYLVARGLHVVRVWNIELKDNCDAVLETILAALTSNGRNPHPDPLPCKQGRGNRTV